MAIRKPGLFAILFLTVSVCLIAGSAYAASFSFVGSIPQDDYVQLFNFSISAPTVVIARTWSFAGGTNAAGQVISAGGFSPVLSLFDATGSQDLLQLDWSGGQGAGPRAIDPISGYAWDSYMSPSLNAGSYILALSEDDNVPNGPTFADGFSRTGQGNFTGPNFTGQPGSFILVDGSQRTNGWAVDIIGADSAEVPEPSSLITLCFGGMAALAFPRRRRRI